MFKPRCVFTLALGLVFSSSLLAQRTINVPKDQPTIQAGINAAANGDTVLVAPGTYTENISFKGKAITVTSSGGEKVTTIDGGRKAATVLLNSGETKSSVLSHFTITGGQGYYYTPLGGIYIGSSASILNNIITENQCYGIVVGQGSVIQGNTISHTRAVPFECSFASGAGIWVSSYAGDTRFETVINNNIIEENTESGLEDAGGNGGAGIAVWYSHPIIENNIIRNNATGKYFSPAGGGEGGGILYESGGGVLFNNLIYGNTSNLIGGGVSIQTADSLTMTNNTIVDNSVVPVTSFSQTVFGGQQVSFNYNSIKLQFVNNIIGGNTTQPTIVCFDQQTPYIFENNDIYNDGGAVTTSYATNDTCTSPAGTFGNFSVNPKFVNAAAADYHLANGSQAIDAGNNSGIYLAALKGASPAADLDGSQRIENATNAPSAVVDIGAYEFAGATSAERTEIALTPSLAEVPGGSSVTLQAQLTSSLGVPVGKVECFTDGGVKLGEGTVDSSGSVSFTATALKPGLHLFYATYAPQNGFPPGVSVHTYVYVRKYPVTLTITSDVNPSIVSQDVTIMVKATTPDTGFVPSPIVLTDNYNTTLATLTPDATGNATFHTSTLALGYHNIAAAYAGDEQHAAGSGTYVQNVVSGYPTAVNLSASSSVTLANQNVTFTAAVTSANGTPTGSVTFMDNGALLATMSLPTAGAATVAYSTSSLPVGLHTITASYVPSGTFQANSASVPHTVLSGYATTTTVGSTPNPSTVRQPFTLAARVSSANGTPTGSMSFSEGGTTLGTQPVDASGNASLASSLSVRGSHTITATYVPVGTFSSSSGQVVQNVTGSNTISILTVAPATLTLGDSVQLTANVSSSSAGTIGGTVTFSADGAPLSTPVAVSGSTASFSTAGLRPGTHSLTCLYSGDDTFEPSTCAPVSITVNNVATSLTLTSSANPALALNTVTYTANLTAKGKPYGNTVLFYVDGAFSKAVASDTNGNATLPLALPIGNHGVSVQFPGNDGYSGASAALNESIVANPTATTLSATPNPVYQSQPLNISATVLSTQGTAHPYGTISVFEGSTQLANLPITPSQAAPVASFSIATLAPGTHLLSAVYTPADGNFLPSSTATNLSVTVLPQGFTLTTDTPSMTVQTEHHATITLMLNSFGGFVGTVQLACGSPLPATATCELPGAMRLTANNSAPVSLTIDTDAVLQFKSETSAPHGAASGWQRLRPLALAGLFPLAFYGVRKRRASLQRLMVFLLLAGALAGLAGCGDQYPAHTPPGTYDLVINASGAADGTAAISTQTLHIGLTVTR